MSDEWFGQLPTILLAVAFIAHYLLGHRGRDD